ncbi:ADP-glyceromanno-heptose 6-epimerase [Candidatus Velamenicoccus archaeovorus]|uniref:ADP-L-glycero-D-manno-heptose-6-epimerase n=1 Tax=Velamenicoccus archaeovorus TaxID=1930593 RepID=A0A410P2J8_VELA1|nr:ADP-glyceromanno-heptose 6-epimerase [Candidatus Velamenicoccus archaeovorus]QAT16399.1 ADP-glyceromanno-heptose 6-epimerase [Candidatus Velamenicoccus archaeovorus]
MIIVTGAAGFIGSCFLEKLNREGIDDIVAVDRLDGSDKWRGLANKRIQDYLDKDDLLERIRSNRMPRVRQIVHMGACSSTTCTDARYVMDNNFAYSRELALWAFRRKVPFLYASSAATYGDGELGFDDDPALLTRLRPLNIYGYSKHLFDLWIRAHGYSRRATGLKFFNVFGPNEYHKGDMASVLCRRFDEIMAGGDFRLFKSYRADYKDGEQKRDFIYVKDAVEAMFFFIVHPGKTGLYNLGTGEARSWNDLAKALFAALGQKPRIFYIDMPEELRGRYQYFTQARMDRLRKAGFKTSFRSLEESVADYAGYLKGKTYL